MIKTSKNTPKNEQSRISYLFYMTTYNFLEGTFKLRLCSTDCILKSPLFFFRAHSHNAFLLLAMSTTREIIDVRT